MDTAARSATDAKERETISSGGVPRRTSTLPTLSRSWLLVLLLSLGVRSALPAIPTLLGDLNNDGQVNVLDVVILNNHINRTANSASNTNVLPSSIFPYFADVNQDGLVTDADLGYLADIVLGINPLQPIPLTRIRESSPAAGETGVSVTRETVFRFNYPLATNTFLDTRHVYATFGGRRILSRVELSSDHRTVTLFSPQEFLPGSARIRVTFDAFGLQDVLGRLVDLNGDGLPGGAATVDFDTLSLTAVAGTAVRGTVFASEPVPIGTNSTTSQTNFVNRPLAGVTITVDGREETLRAITDTNGNFLLQPCPAGDFFVHIDGRTLTNLDQSIRYPDKSYYPFVGKVWHGTAGRTNFAGFMSGSTNQASTNGWVFLPLINQGALQPVSMTNDTLITFPSSVISNNPALAGVQLMVPPDSLFSANNTRGGKVGIAAVPPDRLPGVLPPGLEFPLVITVQTDGGENFDRPVPVCFPNLPDPGTGQPLPPGTKNYLYSFNHDKGEWEAVAPMTVSADGKTICTDPGGGIVQPGWHGSGPMPVGPPPPPSCNGFCCPTPGGNSGGLQRCMQDAHTRLAICGGVGGTLAAAACALAGGGPLGAFICGGGAVIVCMADHLNEVSHCLRDNCSATASGLKAASAGRFSQERLAQFRAIQSLTSSAMDLANPYIASGNPVPAETLAQADGLILQADVVAGGNALAFLKEFKTEIEQELAGLESSDGLVANVPTHSVKYLAIIKTATGSLFIRGRTQPGGQYSLFVPREGVVISVHFYDASTKTFGLVTPNLREESPYLFPHFALAKFASNASDSDADGLPDLAEIVLGSNPEDRDSDGDGISDDAEIDQGTDPLDGRPVVTGIIASVDTPGTAVDVCAINNTAIAADSEAGITVFNASNPQSPIRVAQVDTPGTALAVSCSGTLVAVADGSAGLAVVDITDPPAARIVRQIPPAFLGGGVAQAVAVAADLAFVGTDAAWVSMVELNTGVVLQKLNLGGRVEDLSIEGVTLYAYANGRVHAIPFQRGLMELAGSAASPGVPAFGYQRGRLFVGNGIAYAVQENGYNTISVSNPAAPAVIAVGNTTQFGWKQIVLNGSGLGVAAVGPTSRPDSSQNIYLHDTRDPRVTTNFITQIETPGVARAVSIYNGLAYVADHANGLHVINYLPYDANRRPPSGRIVTSALDGTAPAGSFVVVRAEVEDDVQVRNVEFLLNGQRVLTDGNFPFELVYRVPTNAGATLSFSANIFDTGLNTTNVIGPSVTVTPDIQPPAVAIVQPEIGSIFFEHDDVYVRVAAIDQGGVERVSLMLDNLSVPARRLSLFEWLIEVPIAPGAHTINAVAVDFAGNVGVSPPVAIRVRQEAIGREFSVFHFDASLGQEAISREFTVFHFDAAPGNEAIGREFSLEHKDQ